MGVMPCYRKDCENIMCRTYIDDIGYICSDCENEFKNEMVNKYGIDTRSRKEYFVDLKEFINPYLTYPSSDGEDQVGVNEFFDAYRIGD